MKIGDLIISDNKLYVVYDRNIAITASLTQLDVVDVEMFKSIEHCVIELEIGNKKKLKLRRILKNLLTGGIQLSLKERLNFNKFISWMLTNMLKVDIIPSHIAQSNKSILDYLQSTNCMAKR